MPAELDETQEQTGVESEPDGTQDTTDPGSDVTQTAEPEADATQPKAKKTEESSENLQAQEAIKWRKRAQANQAQLQKAQDRATSLEAELAEVRASLADYEQQAVKRTVRDSLLSELRKRAPSAPPDALELAADALQPKIQDSWDASKAPLIQLKKWDQDIDKALQALRVAVQVSVSPRHTLTPSTEPLKPSTLEQAAKAAAAEHARLLQRF